MDFLIVMPDGCDCLAIAKFLYRQLRGFAYPKDLVVVPRGDVERYGANPNLVLHSALTEGKELYHAAS